MEILGGDMEIATAPAQSLEILETPQEIARALKTTPQTVNAWHRRGLIPSRFAIGRIVRFERGEVLAALASHRIMEGAQ